MKYALRLRNVMLGAGVGVSVSTYDSYPTSSIQFILTAGPLYIYILIVLTPSTVASGHKDVTHSSLQIDSYSIDRISCF